MRMVTGVRVNMAHIQLHIVRTFSIKAIGCALFVALLVTNTFAQKPAVPSDPLLAAMQAELDRSQQELQLQNMQRPFFIEYRLDDVQEYAAQASYGALTAHGGNHQRILRVTVRVGDYKADSSSDRGDGVVQLAAADDDPAALRYGLWSATDNAYKAALRIYSDKQAALKGFQTPPTADDFAREKPTVKMEPLVKLDMDTETWSRHLAEASGLYATDAATSSFAQDIEYCSASMSAVAVNRYLVNTEGTVLRKGYTEYQVLVGAGTQAADGMRLDRSYGSTAVSAKQLDAWDVFRKHETDLLLTLHDLRDAPVVAEEYHGPVLFSGDAAADVVTRLFTPNIEADKPGMGTTARTQGAYASSFKARVLPDFMDVVDDPAMKTFHGTALLGAYDVDDEGVPAQVVDVVKKGVLMNYLVNRQPVKDFPESNGHGRAPVAQPARSHSSVLMLKSSETVPAAEMAGKLVSMAKDQGRDVAYSVETLGPNLSPRLLYRIHTADGKRELVRGAMFDELDQRSLRSDIVAAGNDPYIANSAGPVPTTTIVPSLLFGDIGVKRATQEQEKLPYYAPPPALASPAK